MKLFVLAVVVLTATCNPVTEDCQWGPSYWCQSREIALKCDKTSFCAKEVWKNNNAKPGVVTPVQDSTCEICQLIAMFALNYVEKNKTENMLKTELDLVCNYLGGFGDECRKVVSDALNDIWKYAKEELSADRICQLVKLCPSTNILTTNTIVQPPSVKNSLTCTMCDFVSEIIVITMQSKPDKDKIKDAVLKSCEIPKPVRSECEAFVKKNFDSLWTKLSSKTQTSKQVCASVFDSCPQKTVKLAKRSIIKSIKCDICEEIVKHFADKDTVEGKLDDLCNHMPKDDIQKCTAIINDIFDLIWSNFTKDPKTICKMVDFCSSSVVMNALALMNTPLPSRKQSFKVPTDSGLCEICQLVTEYVKQFIKKNATEEEVKEELEGLCQRLPDSISSECTDLVDNNFDLIWKLVENEVESAEICQKLNLCNSTIKSNKPVKQVKDGPLCSACKVVVSYLKPYIDSNNTEAEVKEAVKGFCDSLPSSLSSECDELVDTYFSELWNLLKNDVDSNDVCQQLGLCDSVIASKHIAIKKVNGVECEVCKLIVQFLGPYVVSNSTEQEVQNALDSFCSNLPSAMSGTCTTLVDTFFPQIWSEIQNDASPDVVCSVIGLCSSKQSFKQLKQSTLCDVCNVVISYLKPFVDSGSSENETENAFESLCNQLPSSASSECNNLVTKYFPLIWQLLKSEIDSDDICSQLGLCNSTVKSNRPVKQVNGVECEVCKLIVQFLGPYVVNNSTEQEVQNALDSFCSNLPSAMSGTCTTLVDTFFPQIWSEIQNDASPDVVCSVIGVCTSKQSFKQLKQSTLCDVCNLVISYLKPLVDSGSSEDETENAFKSLCNLLPSDASSECNNLVTNYFPQIWAVLKSEIDSGDICYELGLCNSTVKSNKPVKQVNSVECDVCKLIIQYLKPYIDNNSTEQEIQNALDSFCSNLPSALSGTCTSLVDNYFPEIWEQIQNNDSPDVVCSAIGLCSSKNFFKPIKYYKKPNADYCELCKDVVALIQPYLNSNSTEQEAKNALKSICTLSIVPENLQKECMDIVNDEFDTIWKALLNDADQVCTLIGFCNSSRIPAKALNLKAPEGIITCFVCGLVIKEVEKLANISKYENVTIQELEKICDVIPDKFQSECKTLIGDYGEKILEALINGESAKTICSFIGICVGNNIKSLSTQVQATVCEDCEDALTMIKDLMTNDPSMFESLLLDFCGEMPSTIANECSYLVKQYSSQIINMIANDINPQSLCKDGKLCKVIKEAGLKSVAITKNSRMLKPFGRKTNGIECDACVEVFEEIEVLLPKEKEKVVNAVSDVCTKYLPQSANALCQLVCTEIGDEIVNVIAYNINPRTDCQVLGVCRATRKSPSLANPLRSLRRN